MLGNCVDCPVRPAHARHAIGSGQGWSTLGRKEPLIVFKCDSTFDGATTCDGTFMDWSSCPLKSVLHVGEAVYTPDCAELALPDALAIP